jgi:hypothetical protein
VQDTKIRLAQAQLDDLARTVEDLQQGASQIEIATAQAELDKAQGFAGVGGK